MIPVPLRRRGIELLDDPAVDPALAARSLVDVALSNRWFGGRRAVLQSMSELLRDIDRTTSGDAPLVLLDVGTGLGDIPRAAKALAAQRGVQLLTIGLELTPALAHAARGAADEAICGNAMRLPFASGSVDVVTCSQVLHHFEDAQADALLRELTRVARSTVIVSDLRRSWTAAALLWMVSFPLRFHPVSRHDGIVSILRGYTAPELGRVVTTAVGRVPAVRNRLGWRVTAMWSVR